VVLNNYDEKGPWLGRVAEGGEEGGEGWEDGGVTSEVM
jgi:hypothetical protein